MELIMLCYPVRGVMLWAVIQTNLEGKVQPGCDRTAIRQRRESVSTHAVYNSLKSSSIHFTVEDL